MLRAVAVVPSLSKKCMRAYIDALHTAPAVSRGRCAMADVDRLRQLFQAMRPKEFRVVLSSLRANSHKQKLATGMTTLRQPIVTNRKLRFFA
jgi:hypothetical protein